MKTLEELLDKENSAWKIMHSWFDSAKNQYEILPKDVESAGKELVGMQLSTKTPLGSIIYETGGILIDNGWLRILGSGSPKLPRGFFEWNFGKTFESSGERPLHLLVADDVIGGYFAINGGGLGEKVGMVYYYHPTKQKWESIGLNYSQFIGWALTADIGSFYHALRWKNWQSDIQTVRGDQVINRDTKVLQPIERHYQSTFTNDDKYSFGYSVN
ncbi:DUF2625 family protein [Otariodibacter oris]|uniref:Uncharacterized protein DUF2625 n=1 Tax=Otariodibacter oris TaxID=1032623 RepID=A0A420XJ84_9PAST|nr:DUF2625 family protein [Otariodibacter oris]QGM80438.1 hypothetical protein A6A10_03005 [Otariodibacter oris]RKR77417.1 uncharacterized protein DUF2625 [Otariodibacter oris]